MKMYKCFDPVSATLLVISAVGTIYSGYEQNKAAKREASLQEAQAAEALAESKANAEAEAYNQRQELNRQKLAYLSNGVTLSGSPTDVLMDTASWGQKSVDSILRQGTAQYNLGMGQAANTRASGRAALIGGFTSAAGSIGSSYITAKSAGLIKPKTYSPTSIENYVSGGKL